MSHKRQWHQCRAGYPHAVPPSTSHSASRKAQRQSRPQDLVPIPSSRAQRRFIPSAEGSLDQPAGTPASRLAVATCSTCRVVRPHRVPFPFPRRDRGPAFSHPHRVLPPWLHLGRLPPLPMGFQDPIFQAQPGLRSLYPGPQGRGHYLCPRGTSVQALPLRAARVLARALAGLVVAGRQTTTHGPPKVNNSLTRLVTTSALPRRRVTCARHCGLPQSSCFRIILGLVITAAALLSRQCPRWASWVAAADTR